MNVSHINEIAMTKCRVENEIGCVQCVSIVITNLENFTGQKLHACWGSVNFRNSQTNCITLFKISWHSSLLPIEVDLLSICSFHEIVDCNSSDFVVGFRYDDIRSTFSIWRGH